MEAVEFLVRGVAALAVVALLVLGARARLVRDRSTDGPNDIGLD